MFWQQGGRMNIQGITPSNYANGVSGASPIAGGKFDGQFQGAMGDVASLLNMSGQQLAASLAPGGNLSSVAQSAGVSQTQLVSTIEKGLTDAGSKLTGTRLENIANRIANHRGLGRHHHGGGAANSTSNDPSASFGNVASSVWQATGVDPTTLG
jgi:hypothetical protein